MNGSVWSDTLTDTSVFQRDQPDSHGYHRISQCWYLTDAEPAPSTATYGELDTSGRWTADFALWVDDHVAAQLGRSSFAERLVRFRDDSSEELVPGPGVEIVHAPDLVTRSVNAMQRTSADLFSVAGRQELGGFWEKVIQPQMFTILSMRYGGTESVTRSTRVSNKIANGQCIFVKRESYDAIGGHAIVRGEKPRRRRTRHDDAPCACQRRALARAKLFRLRPEFRREATHGWPAWSEASESISLLCRLSSRRPPRRFARRRPRFAARSLNGASPTDSAV